MKVTVLVTCSTAVVGIVIVMVIGSVTPCTVFMGVLSTDGGWVVFSAALSLGRLFASGSWGNHVRQRASRASPFADFHIGRQGAHFVEIADEDIWSYLDDVVHEVWLAVECGKCAPYDSCAGIYGFGCWRRR